MLHGSLLGLLGLVSLVVTTILLTAPSPLDYLDLPSLVLVLGGSFFACLIANPAQRVLDAFKRVPGLFVESKETGVYIDEIVRYTKIWQKCDLHELEREVGSCRIPFLKHGIDMLVDNISMKEIKKVLQWRMKLLAQREQALSGVFDDLAQFAPAFGMIGTLVGLVNMLAVMNPAAGVELIGSNMAIALITTFYGVLLANGLFKPLAKKIRARTVVRLDLLGLVLQGIEMMSEKRTPSYIRATLSGIQESVPDELGELE